MATSGVTGALVWRSVVVFQSPIDLRRSWVVLNYLLWRAQASWVKCGIGFPTSFSLTWRNTNRWLPLLSQTRGPRVQARAPTSVSRARTTGALSTDVLMLLLRAPPNCNIVLTVVDHGLHWQAPLVATRGQRRRRRSGTSRSAVERRPSLLPKQVSESVSSCVCNDSVLCGVNGANPASASTPTPEANRRRAGCRLSEAFFSPDNRHATAFFCGLVEAGRLLQGAELLQGRC